ncbi:MAG: C40 family peptidase [Pontiellaceae bacterium]|nr:C40 family peptidase [Pontiellaceae bacterium]
MKPANYWTFRRIGIIWLIGAFGLGVVLYQPVGRSIFRLYIAAAIPALWMGAGVLMWRIRWMAYTIWAAALLAGIILLLPGKKPDPAQLRAEYIKQLRDYEGIQYVWGGENRRGIDCSGLVRRALIDSDFQIGITQANPRALRSAIGLWWNDASAQALLNGYLDLTVPLAVAPSINEIESALLPGDLAVTTDGVHVLAYLGNQQWIEADPADLQVLIVHTPSDNIWFNKPVKLVRWNAMKAGE